MSKRERMASDVIRELEAGSRPEFAEQHRRFSKGDLTTTTVMGITMGEVFAIAKKYSDMPLRQIEQLLDDQRYHVRMSAVAIMDFKARSRHASDELKGALYDLYLRKHDRIDHWGLVDRAAPHVVGEYLLDRDRSHLRELAGSADPNRRRTAIVSTHAFIRRGQVADTFDIAAILAADPDKYVQKAIASWVREAGKRCESSVVKFLTAYKAELARSTFRDAAKLLPPDIRKQLL